MTWVKFHDELRRGAKRGLPRAVRFIYMELSLEARPGRGVVELPLGMGAVDGVADLLGGNREEVEQALTKLAAGADPMIRIEGDEGSLRLVVPKWDKWNSVDSSTERSRKHREAKGKGSDAPPADDERNGGATEVQRVANADATEAQRECNDDATLLDKSREDQITHTGRAADSTPDPSPTLGALRSHRVILDAANGAPLGADTALARLAEAVDAETIPRGLLQPWVDQAIADAARDLAAEASGVGQLAWTVVATKVVRFASRAKATSGPAVGPSRSSGATALPPSEDERWTAATWQQARVDHGLPDGEPDPRRIAALWTAACKASMGAKPVDKWKPGPRDIVTHWIRTYLDTPQTRAGGDADQGYPLAFLASRATSGEGVTLPTKADVQRPAPGVTKLSREDFAPPPPRPPVDHAALDALTAALSSRPAANSDDAAPPVRRPARMS